jgi:hypothetical protein
MTGVSHTNRGITTTTQPMDMTTPAIGVPSASVPGQPYYSVPSGGITYSGTQGDVAIGPSGTFIVSTIAVA